jgi:hypothetical protein
VNSTTGEGTSRPERVSQLIDRVWALAKQADEYERAERRARIVRERRTAPPRRRRRGD